MLQHVKGVNHHLKMRGRPLRSRVGTVMTRPKWEGLSDLYPRLVTPCPQ
jgi:hypothetical protein